MSILKTLESVILEQEKKRKYRVSANGSTVYTIDKEGARKKAKKVAIKAAPILIKETQSK